MAPTTKQKEKKAKGQARRSKPAVAADLETLRERRSTAKKDYMRAPKTTTAYDGHIRRGKAFIAKVVEGARQAAASTETDSAPLPAQLEADPDEDIDYSLLAVAFENPPNRYSPHALELFMTQKCIEEGLTKSLCDQIHAAFKAYWSSMGDSGQYRGRWSYNHETGKATGNPADSPEVEDMMQTIKNRSAAADDARDHAEAMTLDDLRKMMNWSLVQCPQELVDSVLAQAVDPDRSSQLDVAQILFVSKHLQIRGFFSSAFVLWTRNLELCRLQGKHYTLDLEDDNAYRTRYDKIRLALRKGWTRKNGTVSQIVGRNYKIYNITKQPEINMYYHLRQWRTWLEAVLLRRPMRPEDHLFPTISVNGQVQITVHINLTVVQSWINEAAVGVEITVQYTTHSFRRGGAQYRFMWCPEGQRWSLSRVRWWGGWTEGEHSDTLVKYLVDVLDRFEHSHENALCPIQTDLERSFMGEHIEVASASAAEVREAVAAVKREVEEFKTVIQPWMVMFSTMWQAYPPPQPMHVPGPLPHSPGPFLMGPSTPTGAYSSLPQHPNPNSARPATPQDVSINFPTLAAPRHSLEEATSDGVMSQAGPSASSAGLHLNHPSFASARPNVPLAPFASSPPLMPALATLIPPFAMPPIPGTGGIPLMNIPPAPRPLPHYGMRAPPYTTLAPAHGSTPVTAPAARKVQSVIQAVMPTLPRGAAAFKALMRQWDEVDPNTGYALKDWPEDWYTGDMRLFNGTKYSDRREVALEFIKKYERDEAAFAADYPEIKQGFTALLHAVRKAQIARGERQGRRSRS
ncbi:hypothetical protein EIP86_004161 [Pleurotus ostreatoroseus]|nr:hypothetical protein EIP86_004161 [Pleurotus ostreatoroseus]